MKIVKRLLALTLAMTMVLAMGITAFAEETAKHTVTVTIADSLSTHTFKAYQIFAGGHSENSGESREMSVTGWGSGIKSTDFVKALKADGTLAETFKDLTETSAAPEVAAVIFKAGWTDDSKEALAFARVAKDNVSDTATELKAGEMELAVGYYLVVDVSNTDTKLSAGGEETKVVTLNSAILQVTDTIDIKEKIDVPTVVKRVLDLRGRTEGETSGYYDVADWGADDLYEVQLYGKIPDISAYSTYKYEFQDVMSGQTLYSTELVHVYLSDNTTVESTDPEIKTTLGSEIHEDGCFYIALNDKNNEFTIGVDNLKSLTLKNPKEDGTTTVTPKTGQYIIVIYGAQLNYSVATGTQDGNRFVIGQDGNKNTVQIEYSDNPNDPTSTALSAADFALVFSYELDIIKQDSMAKTPIAGTEFILSQKMGDELTVYAIVSADGYVFDWVEDEKDASTLVTDKDGKIRLLGLDADTYTLTETKATAGYSMPTNPKYDFTIISELGEGYDGTDNTVNSAYNPSMMLKSLSVKDRDGNVTEGDTFSGIVEGVIYNTNEGTLPETGGMGTTLLYVGGIALIMAAGVVVLVRKRAL